MAEVFADAVYALYDRLGERFLDAGTPRELRRNRRHLTNSVLGEMLEPRYRTGTTDPRKLFAYEIVPGRTPDGGTGRLAASPRHRDVAAYSMWRMGLEYAEIARRLRVSEGVARGAVDRVRFGRYGDPKRIPD